MSTTTGTRTQRSALEASEISALAPSARPWNTRWYAQSKYTAEASTPNDATAAHHAWVVKVPMRIRYSETKPERPGRPIEASIATMKIAERTGAGRCRPEKPGPRAGGLVAARR